MRLQLFALFAVFSPSALAAVLPVTSYTTSNGAIGSFNYQDRNYLPCPSNACVTIGAPLTGGTGKLTDGISPTLDWDQQGTNTSWFGWDSQQGLTNPTVTFFFGQSVTIDSVIIWESNSRTGGVAQPGSVTIGGITQALASDTSNTTPHALMFSSLNVTGSSVALQFNQAPGFQWVMIGEVSFNGTANSTVVPEPGTLGLFAIAVAAGLISTAGVHPKNTRH